MQSRFTGTAPPYARHTVANYLGDMLALERHIAAPIDSQLDSPDHNEYPAALEVISQIKTMTTNHQSALEGRLLAVGGDPVLGFKSIWSELFGTGAAALNVLRKSKVSKSLRDDYAALSLAAIGYTMLHATALGLGDDATARLAKRHLDDVNPVVVAIGRGIGSVVLQELQADGERVHVTAAALSERASRAANN